MLHFLICADSGQQLRQDDPAALKDIVVLLQKAVAKTGESSLTVRTKFMIETINDLKNNRMKTGVAASAVASDQRVRMKKTLGTLNSRNIKATEPLRVGRDDIKNIEKKGKWWLVGASWKGVVDTKDINASNGSDSAPRDTVTDDEVLDGATTDLMQLAREHRMNTDVRRSIFVGIMSASDYKDAQIRLAKLNLKKSQELEIPRVLIHCAGSEHNYNPYYTLISRRLCAEHKLRMAFQFSLWDLFRRMGEKGMEEDSIDEEEDELMALDARKIVNLGRMYGSLIADRALPITVLKASLRIALCVAMVLTIIRH